jgi:hypothetical protein
MPDAVIVDPNDRRFNVAEYQGRKILVTPADIRFFREELLEFAIFLQHFEVDLEAVRTPMVNDAKQQLILESAQSADIVAQSILTGQLHQLWDALPFDDAPIINPRDQDAYYGFKKLMFAHVVEKRDYLTRDDLFVIFNFCVGNTPQNPAKLASYLRHHGIELKKVRVGSKTPKGMNVAWQDSDEWFSDTRSDILKSEATALKVVK